MNPKKLAAFLGRVLARPASNAERAPRNIAEDEKQIANGCNAFATDLYGRLRAVKSGNLFFSPYSLSVALAMTYAGAERETGAQMAEVLHFSLPAEELHPAFGKLQRRLIVGDESPPFQLRVANRLWGQQGFHFLPTFLQVARDNYGAELGQVDFKRTDQARKTINAWVEEQTDDKIRDLLAPGVLDATSRLVLANAIYFKARWEAEFGKSGTADAPFYLSSRQQTTAPLMRQQRRLRYAEADEVQILELPYACDGALSMLILLPKKLDGLSDLEPLLTGDRLQKWSAELKSRLVHVHLPRFKLTSEFDLGDALSSMGMPLAFSDKANFSGMSREEALHFSAVIHKAFVEVNEEGTEAAAATAVALRAAVERTRPEPPVEFRADHPFVFLIRDDRTHAILFLGRLTNPRE